MSALFYEIIWLRLLTLFFGVSSFAISTIVGTFMGGIALGSYIFGNVSEKKQNLVKIYAFLELFIGLSSLVVFLILKNTTFLHEIYYHFYNNTSFYALSFVRLALSVLLLLIPSTLIGGTIPLVSKYLIRKEDAVGKDFSKIYYINTFGALVGTVLVSFFFVRYFGVNSSFFFAFLINILIFLFISLLSVKESEYGFDRESVEDAKTKDGILFLAAVIGFIHIGYEVLWVRIFSIITSGTTYVFALVLSGFLLGFMLGGYFISKRIDSLESPFKTLVYIEVFVSFFGALILFLLPSLDRLSDVFRSGPLVILGFELAIPFVLSLIPSVFMGAAFPLILKIYSCDGERMGKKTGNIYFSNTFGTILGSLFVGFVFIPLLGIKLSTFVIVAIGLSLSIFILKKRKLKSFMILFGAVGAIFLVLMSPRAFDFKQKLLYYEEGIVATVSVEEVDYPLGKYKLLNVDGESVAATHPVLVIDSKILAHIPLLIADNPKNAVSVGYGTGGTSYSMVLHGVETYTLEIEEKVVDAASLEFEELNHGVQNDESLNIVVDDARNFLSATDKEFDVIVTDVTNLKYKSNPSLYSVDYFEILAEKSTDDGVVAVWMPINFVAIEDIKTLINSFHEVFPHTTAWYYTKSPTHFLVLVGTKDKLLVDFGKLGRENKKVQEDLDEIEIKNRYDFASMLFMGEEDIESLISGAELHTDNNPILEFSNISDYYKQNQYSNIQTLLDYKKENLVTYFSTNNEERSILNNYFIASFYSLASQFAFHSGDNEKGIELGKKAEELRNTEHLPQP
jgi:spermidine synthase